MILRIRYRDAEDDVTERDICDIEVFPPNMINAHCKFRNGTRSFALSRIETAVDLATGEDINDIWRHFGLQSLKSAPITLPQFQESHVRMTTQQAASIRKSDKRALFNRYKFPVIAEIFRRRLYALFNNQCFVCGRTDRLEMDHHIPQSFGGRLVPGNIVILCNKCNIYKRTRHPRDFYSSQQIELLTPILLDQIQIFDFNLNWERFYGMTKVYLEELGVAPEDIDSILNNPNHPYYIESSQINRNSTQAKLLKL